MKIKRLKDCGIFLHCPGKFEVVFETWAIISCYLGVVVQSNAAR